MGVEVLPATFSYVHYDATEIADLAASLLERLGMSDRSLRIEVDETTPLARIAVVLGDPIVIQVQSGAFEDTRVGQVLSRDASLRTIGRSLLRARDRLDGTFGEAPADDDLTNAQTSAWDAYCLGRLERIGVPSLQQRTRYDFRNRHGFTDHSDATFDDLWSADRLTWAELDRRSQLAVAPKLAV